MVSVRIDGAGPTPRHEYAVDLVLRVLLGLEWEWTEDEAQILLPSGGLLASTEVVIHPPIGPWKGWELPYAAGGELEVFAFAFWVVTRMEEWTSAGRDGHGRFQGEAGWASKVGVLEVPIVEQVVRMWAIDERLPEPQARRSRWYATVDVDNALAYRGKPAWRVLAGFGKDALERNWRRLAERWAVLSGNERDPFDTYEALLELHETAGLESVFFFLMADRGPYDEGLLHTSKGLHAAIRAVALRAWVGIHPGYASHGNAKRVEREVQRLENVLGKRIRHGRQHYLLHEVRSAWPALVAAGIEEDWSMGYADRLGFRAGMARPFPAYDLAVERTLPLVVHPVMAMDVTLARYMALEAGQETLQRVWRMAEAAWAVGGDVVTIWHNETFAGRGEWNPWRQFYQTLVQSRPDSLR